VKDNLPPEFCRSLTELDKPELFKLNNIVLADLERKDFIDVHSNTELEKLFDANKNFGAYDGADMVGYLRLTTERNSLKLPRTLVGERKLCTLNHAIVHPEHYKRRITFTLANMAMEEAKKENYEFVFTTVHPENMPSKKIMENLLFKKLCVQLNNLGVPRIIYAKEL
jgi:predicted N-acetyltransferase YhbS